MPRRLRATSQVWRLVVYAAGVSLVPRVAHVTTNEICVGDLAATEHPGNWETTERAAATIPGVSFPGNVSIAC
jgi:hypothetical protein